MWYPTPSVKARVLSADGDRGHLHSPILVRQWRLPLWHVLDQESNMTPGSPGKLCTVVLSSDFQAPLACLIRDWWPASPRLAACSAWTGTA